MFSRNHVLFALFCLTPAAGGQLTALRLPEVVASVGDVLPGSLGRPVTLLGGPVRDETGRLGFIGAVSDGEETEGFFWIDDGIAFLARDVGASNFDTNGDHGLGSQAYTGDPFAVQAVGTLGERYLLSHRGVVQAEGEPAPGLPAGTVVQFVSGVQMNGPGRLFWRALYIDVGQQSAFYRSLDASASGRELVLIEGDFIGRYKVRRVSQDFDVSEDGANHAHILSVQLPGQGQRGAVYLNGGLELVKGQRVPGTGETWQAFGEVATNNAGELLVQARTSGIYGNWTGTEPLLDNVLVFGGEVVQREGDLVGGVRVEWPGEPRDLLLDDDGGAAYIWASNGVAGPYHLFYTSDVDDFEGSTRLVVSENTWLDTDGDGTGDVFLDQFRFKARTLAFGAGGKIRVLARILEGGVLADAILSLPLP